MRRTIWLPVAPFSINSYYGRDRRHKTPAAREWEQQVFHALSAKYPQQVLKELREAYLPEKHSWSIRLIAFYPNFFTKSGNISNKTHDITNWEKPLVDLLFSPRYHDAPYPYGAPNLNCDDRFLVSLYSRKRPYRGEDQRAWIKIQIGLAHSWNLRQDAEEPKKPEEFINSRGTAIIADASIGGNSSKPEGEQ
jgi:hypothetical protein